MSDEELKLENTYRFVRGRNYLALPREPTPWIIKKMVPASGLTNFYGRPKTGKSFATLEMAFCIADPNCPYWVVPDFPIERHGPVIYLQCDTPRDQWSRRIENILETHPYNIDDIYWADTLLAPYPFDILNPRHREWLKAAAADIKPVAVFIDTLREVHSGDEDNSTAMRNVISGLVEATRPGALIMVSHTRKSNPNFEDDIMEGQRGSSYVAGRMDVVARLTERTLTLKGRATGEEKHPIRQEKATGLIRSDAVEDDERMTEIMKELAAIDMKDAQRLRVLCWMYPNDGYSALRSKFMRVKDKHGKAGGDPKKLVYTHEQLEAFSIAIEDGIDPITGKELPKGSDEKKRKRQ